MFCQGVTLKNKPCKSSGSKKPGDNPKFCWRHQTSVGEKKIAKVKEECQRNTKLQTEKTLPEKIQVDVADDKNILTDFFREDKTDYHKFRGNYTWNWGWLFYLQKQYGSDVVYIWSGHKGQNGIRYNYANTKYYQKGLYIEKWFREQLNEFVEQKNSRFMMGLLTLKVKGGYHSNALCYDKKDKTVTRFEPHGSESNVYDMLDLDVEFEKEIKKTFADWKYVSPAMTSPNVGPQTKWAIDPYEKKTGLVFGQQRVIETKGYCSVWSLLFLHHKLHDPTASPTQIIGLLLLINNEKLRQYTATIVNTVDNSWYNLLHEQQCQIGNVVVFEVNNKSEYGLILKKNPKKAKIFALNLLGKKKAGKVMPYCLWSLSYSDFEVSDNEKYNQQVTSLYQEKKHLLPKY